MEITFYRKLAYKLADKVFENDSYTDDQQKRIRYGLVCFFSDLYKFLMMLVTFACFSLTREFLISYFCMLIIRPFIGGFHAKNEFACILISYLTMIISIFIGKIEILSISLQITLLIFLPVSGLIISPVLTKKQQVRNTLFYKLFSFFTTIGLLLFDYFLYPGQLIYITTILIYLLAIYQLAKNRLTNRNIGLK